MFVDHDHRFTGGYVMGGGVYDRQLYKAAEFYKTHDRLLRYCYKDGNVLIIINARVHFRNLGMRSR
jgi:hypothetical protein